MLELDRSSTVLDLAAGTGKLTRMLMPRVGRVLAVEPVEGMRAKLPPEVEAHAGSAEAIPLGDASVDAVTVGQAFHWFDADRAVAECARVATRGVALLWNVRDHRDELQQRYEEVLSRFRQTYPSRQGEQNRAFDERGGFEPVRERIFEHTQLLDADGLVTRFESTSWIAMLPEAERARLREEVRALAPPGRFPFPYITEVFVYRAR